MGRHRRATEQWCVSNHWFSTRLQRSARGLQVLTEAPLEA